MADIQFYVAATAETCAEILAELSETRTTPPRGLRDVSLPGLHLQVRELEDFDEDNFGAQVVSRNLHMQYLNLHFDCLPNPKHVIFGLVFQTVLN